MADNDKKLIDEEEIEESGDVLKDMVSALNELPTDVLEQLLKNLDSFLDCDYDEAREKIKNYSLSNHITREEIDRYIRRYPDSTFRYFYEMRLDHVLA